VYERDGNRERMCVWGGVCLCVLGCDVMPAFLSGRLCVRATGRERECVCVCVCVFMFVEL